MGAFHYRLAAVLSLRLRSRDAARMDLAAVLSEDERLTHEQAALDGEHARLKEAYLSSSGAVEPVRLLAAHRYQQVLRERQQELVAARESLDRRIQMQRDVLVVADREVRVLEKLRDRQQKRHLDGERKLEAGRLDEFAQEHFRHRAAGT